jgi:hypothetical protein
MSEQPGIELFVDFSDGTATVLQARRAETVPKLPLRRRSIDDSALDADDPCWDDIAVTMLDEAGTALDSYALPARATHYLDWVSPAGRIVGGPRHVKVARGEMDLRCIRLPMADRTDWLLFSQNQQTGTPRRTYRKRVALSLYYTGTARKRSPRTLPFGLPAPPPRPLPWVGSHIPHPYAGAHPPLFPGLPDDFNTPDGWITNLEHPDGTGDPDVRFDIVITGEGFQERQDRKFNGLATRLIDELKDMPPFSSVRNLIRWHVVHVASRDSGVLVPGRKKLVNTFYRIEACWGYPKAPWFLGTGQEGLRRIWWAAEKAVPAGPDLIIVIANWPPYGGHAVPAHKLVIVNSMDRTPDLFIEVAAHECGHAICMLADEYLGEDHEDPSRPDPNKAHLAEVAASVQRRLLERASRAARRGRSSARDAIWWRALAWKNVDLRPDGTFRAVHVPGDHRAGRDPRLDRRSDEGLLGAFWGCQDSSGEYDLFKGYGDLIGQHKWRQKEMVRMWRFLSGRPRGESSFWSPLGSGFFRPMARCRMRSLPHPFCRVCSHLLENAIRDVCGKRLKSPFPPAFRTMGRRRTS